MSPLPLGFLAASGAVGSPFVLLGTAISTGSQTILEVNNIPQTYSHLVIHTNLRSTAGFIEDYIGMRFNGSSSTYYTYEAYGRQNSTSTSQTTDSEIYLSGVPASQELTNQFTSHIIEIPQYSRSGYKSARAMTGNQNNNFAGYVGWFGGVWPSFNAITSVSFRSRNNASFASNSRISVYGIAGA